MLVLGRREPRLGRRGCRCQVGLFRSARLVSCDRNPTDGIALGELADSPDARMISHIERGRLLEICRSTDNLPTETLKIRDSEEITPEAQIGRIPAMQMARSA